MDDTGLKELRVTFPEGINIRAVGGSSTFQDDTSAQCEAVGRSGGGSGAKTCMIKEANGQAQRTALGRHLI
ncbi:hypothetical protein HN018_24120 (plasmid) [Lichenicola cladoniae]|uniref:Uncharacterized protein n=1 Tax=Lichenicola cladoniae TaxID=1484109 RepID=A0A6M8HY17_9PROT|nr:hypothetical protein [Lichenicola cladoniae]NPD68170.1 hypothetical protein [Acetobacteraceae bacterium]QKE93302.1 hypothetical protein HN018_24120 [Lichenicola cladoniae]